MTDEALNMFDNIVQLVDQETCNKHARAKTATSSFEQAKPEAGEGTKPDDAQNRPPTSSSSRTRLPKPELHTKPNASPIHSKARVQKSIRFRPAIVAELEEHLRSLEFAGNQRSLQDVMNDALELWLQTHARSK
jgi:hypothetical protein